MKTLLTLAVFFLPYVGKSPSAEIPNTLLNGSWKSETGVIILSGDYFSYAEFDKETKSFSGTYGGKWELNGTEMFQQIEFSTYDKSLVGKELAKTITLNNNIITIDNEKFIKIDDGSPGKLHGAWLFAGRKREGEMETRDTSQPRKTMKILSGMRFQWIAYHTDTGEFFGTGGGTYTTIGNRYTENIEFFSRDSSRVGASLSFDFELIDGVWHHQGLNSRGEPLYEIWNLRE